MGAAGWWSTSDTDTISGAMSTFDKKEFYRMLSAILAHPIQAVRTRLDKATFARAWAKGHALPAEQTSASALAVSAGQGG